MAKPFKFKETPETWNFLFNSTSTVKRNSHDHHLHFPEINASASQTQASVSSNVSSYETPGATLEDEDQEVNRDAPFHSIDLIPEKAESDASNGEAILTRLRSGVLSPISYCPRNHSELPNHKSSRSVRKSKEKKRGTRDVLETVLKRRSFPVRPCNSYGFFVMTTWGMVKHSSFRATSKKLGKMWSKLQQDERKV
jgi:hypothetical protein